MAGEVRLLRKNLERSAWVVGCRVGCRVRSMLHEPMGGRARMALLVEGDLD